MKEKDVQENLTGKEKQTVKKGVKKGCMTFTVFYS